jgi:hypothetical protein
MNESSSADTTTETNSSRSRSGCEENSNATFAYQPLDHNDDAFRLIKVLPSRSVDGLLQLALWHDTVSSASYRCLSYRWGDQSRRSTVLLNGKRFNVGENLNSFLEEVYARSQSFSSEMWVDSICIDQKCVQERGHQVQRMGKIYSNAAGVVVWLGQGTITNDLYDWLHSSPDLATSKPPSRAARDQWDWLRINPYWSRAWM